MAIAAHRERALGSECAAVAAGGHRAGRGQCAVCAAIEDEDPVASSSVRQRVDDAVGVTFGQARCRAERGEERDDREDTREPDQPRSHEMPSRYWLGEPSSGHATRR